MGECIGVKDSWMECISSQGGSLLSLDISCSDVTDVGLNLLRDCTGLQMLSFDSCEQISDRGIQFLSGTQYLSSFCVTLL